jgi:hypothetical protein
MIIQQSTLWRNRRIRRRTVLPLDNSLALKMGFKQVLESSKEADVVRLSAHSYCKLSRFRFRYKVAGSMPKVFAAASRLDARPKMLRI